MKLSAKAKASLDKVVKKMKTGDLSDVVRIARIRLSPDCPASKWSFNNRVMAYMQTGQLDCRGYRQWQKAGRQVKKGERAAWILAPRSIYKEDEETGERKVKFTYFVGVSVFGAGQTDGEPIGDYLGMPTEPLPLADVAKKWGVRVKWTPTPGFLGTCAKDGTKINVGSGDPAVFFHELAHAAHARLDGGLKGGQHTGQETVAEFTAAVLMEMHSLGDRTGNAWRYIEDYAKDPIAAIAKALAKVGQVLALMEEAA